MIGSASSSMHNQHSSSSSSSMAIDAGRSVGPFFIGMDIASALVTASQYEENPDVIVDRENPFIHDTLLDLPNLGFRLCFDGYSQRLHVIVINLQSVSSQLGTGKTHHEAQESNSPRTTNLLRFVLSFSFKNVSLIRSALSPPDLRHIYRVCGPTIPGHYEIPQSSESYFDSHDSTFDDLPSSEAAKRPASVFYYLKYPGLAFRFPIPYEVYESLKASSDEDLLPFVLPGGISAPVVDQFFLFPPDSPLTDNRNPPWLSPSPIPPSVANSSSNEDPYLLCSPPEDATTSGEYPTTASITEDPTTSRPNEKSAVPPSLVPKQRHWNLEVILREGIRLPWGGSIHFGASLQDVYGEVGSPDRVSLKDIDVVGIMARYTDLKHYLNSTNGEVTSQNLGLTNGNIPRPQTLPSPDYFCNYFLKGFDLLICGVTHRVKKIILHTNLPGHVQFGDYSRCFFSIPLQGPSAAAIDVDSRWDDIERYLGKASPPLLVDTGPARHSSDATGGLTNVRKFYGYPGIAIEVFDKKWIASVSLF